MKRETKQQIGICMLLIPVIALIFGGLGLAFWFFPLHTLVGVGLFVWLLVAANLIGGH